MLSSPAIRQPNELFCALANQRKREFGISLPHSALVCISKHAAGVTSGIQHRVTGGANSWLLLLRISRSPDAAQVITP